MCEPARKLIRLTSLAEFAMSDGEACNGGTAANSPVHLLRDEIDT